MMSASGNMFEIESSRLAQQRSQNPMVRQFADMMIRDHTQLMNQMRPVAARLGLNPDAMAMAPHHRDMLERLSNAGSGAAFDAAYHQAQLAAHQEALSLHRNYAANGDNPDLRTLAGAAVPVIESHLQHIGMHNMQQEQEGPPAGERG